jgi:hypothetical protein
MPVNNPLSGVSTDKSYNAIKIENAAGRIGTLTANKIAG